MKKLLLSFLVALLVFGCTNTPSTNTSESAPVKFSATLAQSNYTILSSGDTLFFTSHDSTISVTIKVPGYSIHPKGVVTNPPPPDSTKNPNYTLIYSNGFNVSTGGASGKGDLDPFNHGQYGKGYIDFASFLTGPGSFHSRPATVSGGERSEVSLDPETPLEGAIEYDVDYNYVVQDQCHSLQWHPSTSGGSASPGFWHSGGKFLINNWIGGKNISHSTSYTIPTGRWIHIRIEYKFSSNGYFRMWVDGNSICSWTGQVGDNSTPYLKIGFNGNFDGDKAEADRSDIQYDNLQVWKMN